MPERTAPTVAPAHPAAVARHALTRHLLAPHDRVLVAVSGGADSVALAGLLAQAAAHGLPLRLVLAHLDHGWRGPAEAERDLQVVQEVARRLSLPLLTAGPPTPPAAGEDAARRWRYATLARLAREAGLTHVATGHHLRDQAETFLVRLLRGSGAHGLAGIPERRALDGGRLTVVRPLLDVHPEALRAFNRAQGLPWREDPTNAGPGERNEARQRLTALQARAPDALRTLADLTRRLRQRLADRRRRLEQRLSGLVAPAVPGVAVCVPRTALKGLSGEALAAALHLLGEGLAAAAQGPWFTRRHVTLVERAVREGGAVDLPRGLTLRAGTTRVWLARRDLSGPDLALERSDRPVAAEAVTHGRPADALHAVLDADVLGPDARLRRVRPEDRFVPLGSRSGRALRVTAWLAKRGVPRAARARAWVLEGERGVAWVVGSRIDAGHALTPRTRRVAYVGLSGLPAQASPAPPSGGAREGPGAAQAPATS